MDTFRVQHSNYHQVPPSMISSSTSPSTKQELTMTQLLEDQQEQILLEKKKVSQFDSPCDEIVTVPFCQSEIDTDPSYIHVHIGQQCLTENNNKPDNPNTKQLGGQSNRSRQPIPPRTPIVTRNRGKRFRSYSNEKENCNIVTRTIKSMDVKRRVRMQSKSATPTNSYESQTSCSSHRDDNAFLCSPAVLSRTSSIGNHSNQV